MFEGCTVANSVLVNCWTDGGVGRINICVARSRMVCLVGSYIKHKKNLLDQYDMLSLPVSAELFNVYTIK